MKKSPPPRVDFAHLLTGATCHYARTRRRTHLKRYTAERIKILHTKEQYEFFRSYFMRRCEETHQINHYFDSDDFQMNEIGIT